MKAGKNISLSTKIVAAITVCIVLFATCIDEDKKETSTEEGIKKQVVLKQPDYNVYAGSEKCATCHKDIYEKHKSTSHFLTTVPATEKNIKGSFKKDKNIFSYSPDLYVEMQKRDSGLFQVVYFKGEEKAAIPFDIIIGSGTKGQSFMYWRDNRLFQMPLSYFTSVEKWANSPGFPRKVQINRPITSRCLECHSTFAELITPFGQEPEEFDHKKIIYGIGCEKCHGPGKEHIDFHMQNKKETSGRFIVNTGALSRKQQLDLCALCHGGRKQKTQPSFTYLPGDSLESYFDESGSNFGLVDVHGNQHALLAASKCFQKSDMTCTTCHDPHKNERGKLALFSERCMNCHKTPHKDIPGRSMSVAAIKKNCIDCHMPAERSNSIVFMTRQGEQTAARFRSHIIAIHSKSLSDTARKSSKN
jgi:hypothetical protein